MTDAHHLPDAVLFEHASGTASPLMALLVACHLETCGRCRVAAALCDSLALADGRRPDLQAHARRRLLGALPARPFAPAPEPEAAGLPAPLRRFCASLPPLRFRRAFWGVSAAQLGATPAPSREAAWLVRMRPGSRIPLHDHGGDELTLVLAGGVDDGSTQAAAGDVLPRAPGFRHALRAADDHGCLALVVSEAPPVPLTFAGRVVGFVAGW